MVKGRRVRGLFQRRYEISGSHDERFFSSWACVSSADLAFEVCGSFSTLRAWTPPPNKRSGAASLVTACARQPMRTRGFETESRESSRQFRASLAMVPKTNHS